MAEPGSTTAPPSSPTSPILAAEAAAAVAAAAAAATAAVIAAAEGNNYPPPEGELRKSCDFCFSRKRRCDGERDEPCSLCSSRYLTCTFSKKGRRGPKPKPRVKVELVHDTVSKGGRGRGREVQAVNGTGTVNRPRPHGNVVLECCLEGVESASQACSGGAHRIELCANLGQGGVTPSIGDIEGALSAAATAGCCTKVHVLIRPRPGDFVYSDLEKQVMNRDVFAAVKAGAHGIVIGALLEDGSIDLETTEGLLRTATKAAISRKCSCSVTFHRAFDCCTAPPLAALETLVRIGIDRVLTSGGADSAWDGREDIARLVKAAEKRLVVMPGGGVNRHNVKQLLVLTGAKEVHVGSGCHENVPAYIPQNSPLSVPQKKFQNFSQNFPQNFYQKSVRLGLSEGGAAMVLKRVSKRRVAEILEMICA